MNVLIVRTVVSIWKIIEMNRINTVVTMIFVTWLCIWGPLCKQWNITLLTLKLFATANRLGAQILTTAPQVVWQLWSQTLGQAMGLISSWASTHLLEWGRTRMLVQHCWTLAMLKLSTGGACIVNMATVLYLNNIPHCFLCMAKKLKTTTQMILHNELMTWHVEICMVSLNFRVPYIYPGKNIIFKITESNHFPYYFEFEMLEIPSKCFAVALNSSTYVNLSTKHWI